MATTTQPIDEGKLNEFMGRFVGDLGATLSAALVVIGDRLGLYRAMADGGELDRGQGCQREEDANREGRQQHWRGGDRRGSVQTDEADYGQAYEGVDPAAQSVCMQGSVHRLNSGRDSVRQRTPPLRGV